MLRPSFPQAFARASLHSRPVLRPRTTPSSTFQNLSQQRNYNGNWRYQRFQRGQAGFRRWAARPTFYYEAGGVAALAGGFYIANLETVPVTGRRRFSIATEGMVQASAEQSKRAVMQQFGDAILPAHDPRVQLVTRVAERLVPHAGMPGTRWEVYVIESEEINAFVTPGGQIFVFSGLLPVCGNEDRVAAVVAHEIGHRVAGHTKEKLSRSFVFWLVAVIGELGLGIPGQFSNSIIGLALDLPMSRRQELEADYIGLLMMAEACYDPQGAISMWDRMDQMEKQQGFSIPQFVSTHPSNFNRQEKIREWMPAAQQKMEASECHQMLGFEQFRQMYG